MSFGSAVHKGLEAMFTGKIGEDILKAVMEIYPDEDYAKDPKPAESAIACLMEFDRRIDWQSWNFIDVENYFKVKMGYGKRLHGFFDGIIERNGALLLLENKTLGKIDERYVHHLLWDEQSSFYIYAARELGFDVRGVLYNLLPRPAINPLLATPEDKRKYKKDGSLYATQRDHDETDEEYLDRVREWYAEKAQFQTHVIQRNTEQLEQLKRNFDMIVRDMKACEKDETFYPNGRSCSVLPCEYAGICLESTPEIIEANFRHEERKEMPS